MNSNNPRGVFVSSRAIIATVIVGVLLVAILLVTSSAASGSNLTTTTTTATQVSITTVGSGSNSSALSINPAQIYSSSNESIVTLQGTQVQSSVFGPQTLSVLGSGFVVQYSGSFYVITNYHVAGATSNLTLTFPDGDAYPATVIGADPYADLAIVSAATAPASEFHPLSFAASSSLEVGQPIVVIGNPFGLSGSMTFGIVSQLGRTLQDPTAGNFSIADVIQFSAPINPGNSGGPLLNAQGGVVGITTATVSGSQGVGFAIPSDTIIRELPTLVSTGSYNLHSYLGIGGTDMNYQLAQAQGTNVTYGVLVENVVQGGPAYNAGLRSGSQTEVIEGQQYLIGGDIIASINGTRIVSNDALATYLEEHTVAGQVVTLGIIRAGSAMNLNVTLGARPPITS